MLALKAENISKQYRLGQVGTGTLTHDLNRYWHKIRGKEDPYLKIGEANDRSTKGSSDYVWSLQDINFEIEQGDAVGIIGRNGAGKSTLLKILSKVTQPTTGKISTKGRIASLLEVGTGFHPEMTGRENIFLNGAILGMTKKEITRKFDEIVDFSGVERYIDTPVKRYSSGMYVRLAFAVAAHLESEILIVDEVLAVGDAEFQKKCLGKMGDVTKGEGRTVLFVSHNLPAVKTLCNKGLVLEYGKIIENGDINLCMDRYFASRSVQGISSKTYDIHERPKSDKVELISYQLCNAKNEYIESFDLYEDAYIEMKYKVKQKGNNEAFYANIHIFDKEEILLFASCTSVEQSVSEVGEYVTKFHIPKNTFNSGIYQAGIAVTSYPGTDIHFFENPAITFEVTENDFSFRNFPYSGPMPGFFNDPLTKETIKL